jgi:hypothetical protein
VLVFANLIVSLLRKTDSIDCKTPNIHHNYSHICVHCGYDNGGILTFYVCRLEYSYHLIVVNCIISGVQRHMQTGTDHSILSLMHLYINWFPASSDAYRGIREILGSGQIVTFGHTVITLPINPRSPTCPTTRGFPYHRYSDGYNKLPEGKETCKR